MRQATPGDRVTVPSWPDRRAGVIVEVRKPQGIVATRLLVRLDDTGELRLMHPGDVDPEAIPPRNRRRSSAARR